VTFSEKKQSYLCLIRQSYVCGKKRWFLRKTSLSEETKRREIGMKSNNQINVPQAREAMDRFKMQAAQDEGVSSTS
jgi:hypothetical protein